MSPQDHARFIAEQHMAHAAINSNNLRIVAIESRLSAMEARLTAMEARQNSVDAEVPLMRAELTQVRKDYDDLLKERKSHEHTQLANP